MVDDNQVSVTIVAEGDNNRYTKSYIGMTASKFTYLKRLHLHLIVDCPTEKLVNKEFKLS
jgi:hypothetical protein